MGLNPFFFFNKSDLVVIAEKTSENLCTHGNIHISEVKMNKDGFFQTTEGAISV